MSKRAIRQALENRLKAMPQVPSIAWENVNVETQANFLNVTLLLAQPDDMGFRNAPYIQRGIFDIGCFYPTNQGPGLADAMAEKLQAWFERGTACIASGVTVNILNTPEVTGGAVEAGKYVVRVRVRFSALIDPVTA